MTEFWDSISGPKVSVGLGSPHGRPGESGIWTAKALISLRFSDVDSHKRTWQLSVNLATAGLGNGFGHVFFAGGHLHQEGSACVERTCTPFWGPKKTPKAKARSIMIYCWRILFEDPLFSYVLAGEVQFAL